MAGLDTLALARYKGSSLENMKNESWSLALKIMANISGWIAFPVIIGLFLGKWLDNKYGTEPWLFLIAIGLCFTVSIFGLATMALQEFKKIEVEARRKKSGATDQAASCQSANQQDTTDTPKSNNTEPEA